MKTVDRLLQDYIAEHRAGGPASPLEYLERVEGTDRLELEALIDGYLTHAPPPDRRPSAQEYAGSLSEKVVEKLSPSLTGVSGLWPTVLPDLRARARVKRSDLVSRLAQTLGVGDREAQVADYYNRMEQGRLPAEGVSTRVLDALGAIVGQSGEALRRMGTALEPGGGAVWESRVFARSGPEPAMDAAEPASPGVTAQRGEPADAGWNEVDRLFLGGDGEAG